MTNTAQKLKKADVSSILTEAVRNRTSNAVKQKPAEPDARFANIAANAFYKILFAPETKAEEKRLLLAKALTFTGTKTETRDRIKEFETLKEYLSTVREEMAQDIIRLTDTEAFSELQQVYAGLNNDLLQFDESMKPLTEILDALYTLRTNGVTFDAFVEIADQRKREEEFTKQRSEKETQAGHIKIRVHQIENEIARLEQDRGLFGMGGIKQASRERIASLQVELQDQSEQATALMAAVKELNDRKPAEDGQYAAEKAKLRELLDISTDVHKERQRKLVENALNFVTTAKSRVGSVREHLSRMNGQVENLFDANNNMTTIYAIMNEGVKDAAGNTQAVRGVLLNPPENEDTLAKVQREQKKMDVEQYIGVLDESARDTMTTYADLTSQSIRIKTMKDANDTQLAKARTLHTQGVAGVADRLSIVLQAVSAAALGESSAMAKDTLMRMHDNTNVIAQKEVIRQATGIDETNKDLQKALDDLGAYGEVLKASTDITRQGLSEMRGKLDELKQLAVDTVDHVHEAIAVAAEVGAGASGSASQKPAATSTPNPFGLGRP